METILVDGTPEARTAEARFLERAEAMHGHRFDYSGSRYLAFDRPMEIVCRRHGLFRATPKSHLYAKSGGCPQCRADIMGEAHRYTTAQFIDRARKVHGERYDYSQVDYRGLQAKVTIVCPKHGGFRMRAYRHLSGRGCRKCAFERIGRHRRLSFWDFLERVIRVHGMGRYEYQLEGFVNAHSKIPIRCPQHGVFHQSAAAHLKGHGCPSCVQSNGERRVREALQDLGVEFREQVRFPGCRDRGTLPFDFFVPSHRLLIEFDGHQHYDNSEHWGGGAKLAEIQRHDRIKDRFAAEHGYRLLRIPYWDLDRVEDIVLEALVSSACTEGIV